MALMTCSECGGVVSTKAPACPHCGAPRSDETATTAVPQVSPAATEDDVDQWLARKNSEKKWTIVAVVVAVCLVGMVLLVFIGSLSGGSAKERARSAESALQYSRGVGGAAGSAEIEVSTAPKMNLAGDWSGPESTQLTLKKNHRFRLKVNLCEGWGAVKGSWRETGGRLVLDVRSMDFRGFAGDDIKQMVFAFKGGALTYSGTAYACAPSPRDTFRRK